MKSLKESDVFDGKNLVIEKFLPTKSSDTSMYDFTTQKISPKPCRKYIHEHTALGPKEAIMTCPNCLMAIKSLVRYVKTRQTHLTAACLCPLGLCALPYCTPYFRNAEHYCPTCGTYLGTSFATVGKKFKCCGNKIEES